MINIKNKKVLMRVDFNLPIVRGKVQDDFRVRKVLPSIKKLNKQGGKLILISHLNVEGRYPSLEKVAAFIRKRYLKNLIFVKDLTGPKAKNAVLNLESGGMVLLENLRKYRGEEGNAPSFAKKLAKLADIYINEAFSASHRPHASIVGVPKYLPSCFGELFKKEIKNLSRAFRPPHPFLLILGGKKIKTKLPLIEKFLNKADFIAIGGKLVSEFKAEKNPPEKIILPVDAIAKNNIIYDLGQKSTDKIIELAQGSKFVLWNGPLGWIEGGFEKGTKKLARALARSDKKIIVGGGDTVGYLDKLGLLPRFSFVSTGGGAMLEFLAKETLPGIEAIVKSNIKNQNAK
ncbi:MAG: hypothetical protein A3H02_01695 [Candidatus Niyogibacteria bacterium RIFCSPLOWO2_12_FULL_41_13]|uniref:Phosphoglycerate kinase n=1 Tax=Candidatus Niyogibacteria bacterium RIFCSPLOWO2_12_FULL_41_13 TaxID=1801726 RepID=A0A1G2F163_9BACT|nr:MAG: hypothetical protein A3H02_01695 [Candidatus Niyogibacteria bacterium RIFCSPLOWO2_12_FULL_41_13]